jgi:hypothetical protein
MAFDAKSQRQICATITFCSNSFLDTNCSVADRIRIQGTFSKGLAIFERFKKEDMISICDIVRNTFCLMMVKFSKMSAKDETKWQKTNFFHSSRYEIAK